MANNILSSSIHHLFAVIKFHENHTKYEKLINFRRILVLIERLQEYHNKFRRLSHGISLFITPTGYKGGLMALVGKVGRKVIIVIY